MPRAVDRVVWCDTNWPINYGFCPSERAWKREMKASFGDHAFPRDAGCCTTFTEDDGSVSCIVTVSEDQIKAVRKQPMALAATIVHEATHVWQVVRDKIGEEKPSAEFEAYTLTEIFENLVDAFERTRPAAVTQRNRASKPTRKARRRG